ncbi:tetratricopeptide (TPR) repeat protein [Bradyrhizobium sp. AZCC 1610]|uniref:tetratricopeptide repeat protein n=1 Tax=Bradyrhizobium sp. AZCC 1610 TaxID=3117020 RepID=UPI002FF0B8B8
MRKSLLGFTVAALTLSTSQPLLAQDDVDQQLGQVHFKTSCNDVAQRRFDRAMRYQHSYWYINAKEVFDEVIKADPTCAMAYWGIALTLMDNPHAAIPRPNLAPGLAAITKAKEMGAKTERERDYIDALMVMYADYDKVPHAQRMRALRDAQAKVAAKYPDDDEAQIAYAITLNTSADLNDKTYAQQAKGAAILEPMSVRLPKHPGVTHYLIHLYDYPATAQKGLDAANRYAKIAPAAPHAQHMPSHIYTRVGYWKESIASNTASVKAAKAEKSVGNYLHAQDYMVYAHLQLAQDQQARAVMNDMMSETDFKATVAAADYALAASPARYAIERGDWDAASQLSVRPSGLNFAMATSHFARALGAARSGKPEAAKADVQKLAELRDKLREAKDNYWSEIVDIQRQVAVAWVLHAEGKYDEALKAMSAAAEAEDKTEKHVITPGPLAPARELYGFMLLDRNMAKEALAAFEATKAKEPNRFQAYAGSAKAADTLGDKAAARRNYQQLVELTANADAERPEVAAAKKYLASN